MYRFHTGDGVSSGVPWISICRTLGSPPVWSSCPGETPLSGSLYRSDPEPSLDLQWPVPGTRCPSRHLSFTVSETYQCKASALLEEWVTPLRIGVRTVSSREISRLGPVSVENRPGGPPRHSVKTETTQVKVSMTRLNHLRSLKQSSFTRIVEVKGHLSLTWDREPPVLRILLSYKTVRCSYSSFKVSECFSS